MTRRINIAADDDDFNGDLGDLMHDHMPRATTTVPRLTNVRLSTVESDIAESQGEASLIDDSSENLAKTDLPLSSICVEFNGNIVTEFDGVQLGKFKSPEELRECARQLRAVLSTLHGELRRTSTAFTDDSAASESCSDSDESYSDESEFSDESDEEQETLSRKRKRKEAPAAPGLSEEQLLRVHSEVELRGMTVNNLRQLLKFRSLPMNGTKVVLVERIMANYTAMTPAGVRLNADYESATESDESCVSSAGAASRASTTSSAVSSVISAISCRFSGVAPTEGEVSVADTTCSEGTAGRHTAPLPTMRHSSGVLSTRSSNGSPSPKIQSRAASCGAGPLQEKGISSFLYSFFSK